MRRLMLLMAIVMMSCSIFSQDIKPRVELIGKDTCFCFTIPQSRIIAKDLERGAYCDSIRIQTEFQLEVLKDHNQVQDTTILILQEKIKNQELVSGKQDVIIQTSKDNLQSSQKKERRERFQKRFFVITTFVFLGFAILK